MARQPSSRPPNLPPGPARRRRGRRAPKAGAAIAITMALSCCSAPAVERAQRGLQADVERHLKLTECPQQEAAATAAQDASRSTVLTISALGDCSIGDLRRGGGAPGSFRARLDEVDAPLDYPFSGVVEVLRADDLTIANLEGTLTDHPGAVNDVFAIRGKPEYSAMLVRGSVELVNVDNNHSHDYGVVGHADTKAALEQAGVGYFGRGRVDRRTIKGVRVVNLGYLGGPRGTRQRVEREVARERAEGGLVIVSFHWGVEGWSVTHPDQISLGRAAIDAGADLVLGHHPHRLQGVETYRGRHIVYSLGNFVFGANSQPEDMDSMIFQEQFRLTDGRLESVEHQIIPVRISSSTTINDFRPMLLQDTERQRVLTKIDQLSGALEAAGREG